MRNELKKLYARFYLRLWLLTHSSDLLACIAEVKDPSAIIEAACKLIESADKQEYAKAYVWVNALYAALPLHKGGPLGMLELKEVLSIYAIDGGDCCGYI